MCRFLKPVPWARLLPLLTRKGDGNGILHIHDVDLQGACGPGRNRLAIWRKIKGLGAVYLQNGVCVLPRTDEHLRRLKMLQNEILEMGGEAVLMNSAGLDAVQQNQVVARFTRDRNEAYAEFLERCEGFGQEITRESAAGKFTYAELEENDLDLKKLKKWLAKIRNLDFFQASLGPDAETALSRCTKILDDFAEKVFLAADESRAIEDD